MRFLPWALDIQLAELRSGIDHTHVRLFWGVSLEPVKCAEIRSGIST